MVFVRNLMFHFASRSFKAANLKVCLTAAARPLSSSPQGLLVVERLSAVHIDSVGEVTGGQVNSQTDHNSIHLGRLKNLSLATVGKKRYCSARS